MRSGGREAIAEVIGAARPLAEMLWQRETEAGGFDTPERRAALDQRIAEVTNAIARSFGAQILPAGSRTARRKPVRADGCAKRARRWERGGAAGRWQQGPLAEGAAPPAPREVLGPPSVDLATSSIVRGVRSVLPSREALILLAVVNQPWLLDTHAEELAALEFRHADGDRLRAAILDAASSEHPLTPAAMRAAIGARGLGALLARVEQSITHPSDWPARENAAPKRT